jgi:hypothetical protein
MSYRMLTNGQPVPEDGSHKEINPLTGQQKGYIVLTTEERSKGFVKPVRGSYIHKVCGSLTKMGNALAETYARNPWFYSGTFCCACGAHFDLDQFHWEDGEPMDPSKQEGWAAEVAARNRERDAVFERTERAELARLKAKYEAPQASDAGESK